MPACRLGYHMWSLVRRCSWKHVLAAAAEQPALPDYGPLHRLVYVCAATTIPGVRLLGMLSYLLPGRSGLMSRADLSPCTPLLQRWAPACRWSPHPPPTRATTSTAAPQTLRRPSWPATTTAATWCRTTGARCRQGHTALLLSCCTCILAHHLAPASAQLYPVQTAFASAWPVLSCHSLSGHPELAAGRWQSIKTHPLEPGYC